MGNRCPREARRRGRAPDLRPFRVSDVVQTIGEEWKVTAEDNMRRETNHGRGLLLFEQIGEKALECDLSLCERSLIKSGKDFSRLDQRDEFLEEIGRDHLDLAKQSFLLKSLEDRDAVRRTNVQALRLRLSMQQRNGLAISFLGTLMRLNRRQEAKVRSQHGQSGRESAKFFGVIEGGKF